MKREATAKAKERPIIMSAESVRAILDGRKKQTRRVAKEIVKREREDGDLGRPVRLDADGSWSFWRPGNTVGLEDFAQVAYPEGGGFRCPYGVPGDRLWVKEVLVKEQWVDLPDRSIRVTPYICYEADGKTVCKDGSPAWPWERDKLPSIFCPRWASRLLLEITDVRVERVQEISFEDCQAEGCDSSWRIAVPDCPHPFCLGWHYGAKYHFQHIWDSLNAKRGYAWETNPWVWVIAFKRIA